ncbi:MAG: hypothetical protein MH204_10655 [Fimbriimonadaceae bacterium]|nr:hypothetical protein [Fimbriimonadaceae bacterium]
MRLLGLTLLAVLGLTLAGCGGGEPTPAQQEQAIEAEQATQAAAPEMQ